MPVARHPPPRSLHEQLPHTAPASGNNAKTYQGRDRGSKTLHFCPKETVELKGVY